MRHILLIHGMWCRPHVWDDFRQPLEADGAVVHAPTLLWHDTEPSYPPLAAIGGTSIRSYVEQMVDVVEELPEAPLIVGHSMGGLIAQILAERVKTRGVVALGTAPAGNLFAVEKSPLQLFMPTLLRYGFWYKPHRPSWKRMRRAALQNLPEETARALYDSLVWESGRALAEIAFGWTQFSYAAWVNREKSSVPKLFLTGDEDGLCPPKGALRTAQLQHSEFELLYDMGHWLIGEPGWENVADRVLRFEEKLP